MLDALATQKVDKDFGLNDFKIYVSLCSEMSVSTEDAEGIVRVGWPRSMTPACNDRWAGGSSSI